MTRVGPSKPDSPFRPRFRLVRPEFYLILILFLGPLCFAWPFPTGVWANSGEPMGREKLLTGRLRAADLFQRRCSSCHAADGTGSGVRDSLPQIPDFTNSRWQERRSDAQLLV